MKRFLLLVAMVILAPSVALAQGNTTLIRALPEPLPSCTPSTQPFQPQPIVWDITAQAIKTCTAVNTWTGVSSGPGTGVTSVSVSGGTTPFFSVTVNTPTTTPQLAFTVPTQTANCVFAGPSSGGAAAPTCRTLVPTDLPVILLANTPLTTNGDLLTVSSGLLARLAQGGNGTFLGVSAGVLGFYTPAGAGTVTNTLGSLTQYHLAVGNAGSDLTVLAALGTSGAPLLSAGAGAPPAFGQLNLANAAAITGNIPIANICSGTLASATTFLRGDCTWAAPSVLWNNIGSPIANLALTMGVNTSTFNQTNAATWTWANVTNAIHLTPQNSPIHTLAGTYFNGSASAVDSWAIQDILGTADNGTSTFTLSHSGSSGQAAFSVPNLIIASLTTPGSCVGTGSILTAVACGTSGASITVNSGSPLTSPVNFQNGTPIYGITINALNPSASNVAFQIAGTLAIAGGGTSAPTAIAAFNNLTPMNTTGDTEYFNAGSAQRLAIGANGLCYISNGTIPIWNTCPGGFADPTTTLGDMIVRLTTGPATRLPGPTTVSGVPWQLIDVPAAGLATAEQWALAGVPIRANTTTGDTLLVTDRAGYVSEANPATVTFNFPNTSTAGIGGNFVFVTPNLGAAIVNLTPTTPQTIDSNTSTPVFPGWAAWVYQNNAASGWLTIRNPTPAAFPTCTAASCTLAFNPATGITTNTAVAAATVPFSGIQTGINTSAQMTLSSSAQFIGTGTAIFNMSGLTGANSFLIPAFSGALPTSFGALAYDTASQTWRAGVSAATNIIPTVGGITNPVNGNIACWGPNATLTSGGCSGGSSGSGQINYPITVPSRVHQFGFSITAATTVGNSGAATTLIGASAGRQTINSGSMLPSTSGMKTIKVHAVGTVGTNSSGFALTVNVILGGITLSSITAPTIASLSGAGWELDYDLTVNSLTTANVGGCVHIVGTAAAELIGCASNASVSGLNFAADQLLDVQVTWTTANAANTITVNSLTANVDQGT